MVISNSLKKEIFSILNKLMSFPSENPPGLTNEIVSFLIEDVFREEEGYRNKIVKYEKDSNEFHNLITTIGEGKEKIILTGHLDVIPPGDPSLWSYPPFEPVLLDGKLYGRGSADMKGGVSSLIGVIKLLKENPSFMDKFQIVFAGTADEEAGMRGSIALSNENIMESANLLIVGEPTNMKIGVAEKGLLWLNLYLKGKAAHGSMPQNGINSIESALKIIPHLHKCLKNEKNEILGRSTLNIGKIRGGTAINVVPDQTTLEIDYRLIPSDDPEEILDTIKKINLKPCEVDIEIIKSLPALKSDVSHSFIQNLQHISNAEIIGLPYATDAAHLLKFKKSVPFVIFGPGEPEVIHKVDEYVYLNQVYEATEYLTGALLQTYL